MCRRLTRSDLSCIALASIGAIAMTAWSAACSDPNTTSSSITTTSTGTATTSSSSSGTGGGASDSVCVSSPAEVPFGGTDLCPTEMPATPDTLDASLAKGGLTRCKVALAEGDVALSGWPTEMLIDKHRLPDFTPLHRGPLRMPAFARRLEGTLNGAAATTSPVGNLIATLSARRGHSLAHVCMDLGAFAPAAGDTTPLATAVLLLDAHRGQAGDEAALREAALAIPLDLQKHLASIVGAIDLASVDVESALAAPQIADRTFLAHAASLYYPGGFPIPLDQAHIDELDAVDVGKISEAAALLAATIERATLSVTPDATFAPFEADTPIGKIVVHDSSADKYVKGGPADGAALLFDLGGDDIYEVPAGASDATHPVSVAIDVRGADHYRYKSVTDSHDVGLLSSDALPGRHASTTTPDKDNGAITLSKTARQGAGNAGIGFLFDLGKENDDYRSLAMSQGFAAVGVGVLYDAGGDDTYTAEAASQGSALYGIGALVDQAGDDHYASFTVSQGFGGVEGVGLLFDVRGDDDYYCDPGDPALGGHPLYFSPQLPGKGNTSMSQGAAQGRRPSSNTDVYLAGGLGILRDGAGKDRYTASVFAQGSGYWQGLGMLLEGGTGNDVYDALWYVQGAAAHFSLGFFIDEGGDDQYDPTFTVAATSIGVGHDFSAAIHLDLGGNDVYRAPGLSLGSGNINGIGFFANVGGNDTYHVAGDPTLGAGNYSSEAPFGDPRQAAPTIGIFVDSSGIDEYRVGNDIRPLDGTTWSYEPQPYPAPQMVTTERGCGADAQTGAVVLP